MRFLKISVKPPMPSWRGRRITLVCSNSAWELCRMMGTRSVSLWPTVFDDRLVHLLHVPGGELRR